MRILSTGQKDEISKDNCCYLAQFSQPSGMLEGA